MAPLTFTDTHNMIAFLTKSDASEGFDQIVDFLNAHPIQYALMVNPPIYVSCIKQFWDSVSVKKTNDVVRLQALIDRKKVVVTEDSIRQDLRLDDADGVECLPNEEIFAELFMSVKRTAWNEVSSSMASVVICPAIEGQEVREEEEIQVFWFKEVKEELGDDEDVTLVDVDTTIEMDDDTYGRMEEDVTVVKEINVAEPIVFDDEEVTMTMAQTLIKMKAKKARILDEQMAKRLQDEEIEQAAARKNRRKRI
nr:hypothetical protein [Tanacetum cinerariifolium]